MQTLAKSLSIALLTAGLLVPACKPKGKPGQEPSQKEGACCDKDNKKEQKEETSGSGLMDSAAGLMAMNSFFSQIDQPGIYDEKKSHADYDEDEAHNLSINFSGPVSELQAMSLFGSETSLELRALQERLTSFSLNENLKSLILRFGGLQMSMAAAEEIRNSLVAFKAKGKTLLCHSESASMLEYYLMSTCDTIAFAPTGSLSITGVAATPVHLKGLLDKLGVTADFLHVGDYKGAAEPLTLDKPSPAMEETLGAILDHNFELMVGAMADGRKKSKEEMLALVDTAIYHSADALKAGLIDQEITFEAFRDSQKEPWVKGEWQEKEEPGLFTLMQKLGVQPRARSGSDHVALVYALGNIIDGEGEGMIGARGEIAGARLVETLRSLAAADSVKAVVLRVDSGGGSALASELIWHAMKELQAKKPVVVSMGGVAASGGYYISAGANRIFADASTLTGSIGVVGGKLAIGGALENLGVKTFPMGRGKRATLWTDLGPWNADERATIQKMMEDIYKVFTGRVAEGRKMEVAAVHKIAQGRVWTGSDALKHGLVDELGGLKKAINHAHSLAGIDDFAHDEIEVYPPEPTLMDFVTSFSGEMGVRSDLVNKAELLLGKEMLERLQMPLDTLLSFRKSQLQTRMVLPVLFD